VVETIPKEVNMAKVLYSATMSLDGFIAGASGDMSWLSPFLEPNPTADDLVGRVGALLVGNRTFRGDDPNTAHDSSTTLAARMSSSNG
jgi:riboflavin biosynthesis pyrimidine reductase